MAFPFRSGYARPGYKPVPIRSDPEFEDINNALFGKPRAQASALPLWHVPGAKIRAPSPLSEQSLSSSPPRKVRKNGTKRKPRGLSNVPQPRNASPDPEEDPPDESPPLPGDAEEETASIRTTSTAVSRGGGGKKKKKPPPAYDSISATVRKAIRDKPKVQKHRQEVVDLDSAPEVLRFEAEMEALKNYSLNVEFEDDYWRETKQNADRSQQEEYVEQADDLTAHGELIRPLVNLKDPDITAPPKFKRPQKSKVVSFAPSPGDFTTPGKPSNKRTLSRRRTTRFSTTPAGPMASTPVSSEHKDRQLHTDMSPIVSASKQQTARNNDVPVPKNVAKDIQAASEDDWEETSKAESSNKKTATAAASQRQLSGKERQTIVIERTSALHDIPRLSAKNNTASVDSGKTVNSGSRIKQKRVSSRNKRSTAVVESDAVFHDVSPYPRENTPKYIDVEEDIIPPRESDTFQPVTDDWKDTSEPTFGIFKKPMSPESRANNRTDQSEIVVARTSLRIGRGNKTSVTLASAPIPAADDSSSRRISDPNDVVIASVSNIFPVRRSKRTIQPARTLQRSVASPAPTSSHGSPAPVTPTSSTHSVTSDGQHRIQRESLVPAFFSPAVVRMSHDGRASFIHREDDHSRTSVRRSIVQGTRKSPLDLLLEISSPSRVIDTDHLLAGEGFTSLIKIGEGSFADVFSAMRNGEEVVLKIVPVDGKYLDGQAQTSLEDILSESIISIELSRMLVDGSELWLAPVFAKTHFIKVAQGSYPDEFGQRHDSFARNNSANCLNQHPVMYPPNQRFVIIGLNNGGQELETFPLANYQQARSVFMQVALGLAIAEDALEFEHRDLHISNILVRLTTDENIVFRRNDRHYVVPSCGIYVTIIDWTLSRIKRKNRVIYKDLSTDKQIFTGKGDIQYDVYRKMRKANKNDWSTFRPGTNVMWLEYLQNKLLKEKTISPGGTMDKKAKEELEKLRPRWKCQSARELVELEKMFVHLPEE